MLGRTYGGGGVCLASSADYPHPYPHNPRSRYPLPQAFTAPPPSTEAAIPPGQPPQEVAIAPSPKAPPASPRSTAAFTSGNQEVP